MVVLQRGRLLARVPLTLLELLHDLIEVVARRILHRRERLVGLELLEPQRLADGQQVPVVYVSRGRRGERAAEPETRLFLVAPPHLEWIALEVYHAGSEHRLDSRVHEARRGFGRDREIHLPILVAHRRRMGAGIVEEDVARGLLGLSLQVVALIEAVERGLDDARVAAGLDLRLEAVALRAAGDVDERGQPVERGEDLVLHRARLDDARPADDHRRAHAAFPGVHLRALERRDAAVGEGEGLGAVVGGEGHDGVVELAHLLQLLQHVADIVIHLLHAGFVDAPVLAAGLADHGHVLVVQHGRDVHARRVVPDEERLVGLLGIVAVEEVDDLGRNFLVHPLRTLKGQRALVLAGLVLRRAVGGLAPDDRTRRRQAGLCLRYHLRIHRARHFRKTRDRCVPAGWGDGLLGRGLVNVREAHALHRIQVVQIAPELVEAVGGRQRVGVVAQVVFAELAGVVAEVAQEPRERRRAGPQVGRAAGQLRRDHARAQRVHAGEEGVAPGRAALLGVVVHELGALLSDAVDVGRFADHQPLMVDARLHPADVVAHDEENVWFLAGCCAAAGVLAGPDSDTDINVVAPSNAAQDRLCQLGVLRGGVAIKGGLSGNMELNMATLSCL